MRELLNQMTLPQLAEFACLLAEALIRAGRWSLLAQARLLYHLRRAGGIRDKAA